MDPLCYVLGLVAIAFLIGVFCFQLEKNSDLLREVRDRYDNEPKWWERAAMIPAAPHGLVDAVSTPEPRSPRARPDVPYVGADEDPVVVLRRQRPQHDTLGSWAPSVERASDTICEIKDRDELPDVDDCVTNLLPRCFCGSIDVEPKSGLFLCNSCRKLGALQRSPHSETTR